MKKAIILSHKDNVATVLEDVFKNDDVEVKESEKNTVCVLKSSDDINRGHKIAVKDIEKDSHVMKYGQIIGKASMFIQKGDRVHTHNLESERGRGDLIWK